MAGGWLGVERAEVVWRVKLGGDWTWYVLYREPVRCGHNSTAADVRTGLASFSGGSSPVLRIEQPKYTVDGI